MENKISRITFWWDDEYIYGFQAFYYNNNTDHVGQLHLNTFLKDKLRIGTIEIAMDDDIKSISGNYSHGLSFLKFETLKGDTKEFGNQATTNTAKNFTINIGAEDHPSMIFAGLTTKKGKISSSDFLNLKS